MFPSCKKDTPHFTISSEMEKWFVFQKNSYWIYSNDSTLQEDSAFVNNTIYSTQGVAEDGEHKYSFDMISLFYSSKILNHSEIHKGCSQDNTVLYFELSPEQYYLDPYPIAYIEGIEPKNPFSPGCGWQGMEFSFETIGSLKINDSAYKNVIHSNCSKTYQSATQSQNISLQFFFAKNIGLLKFQYLKNDTIKSSWSLKRYSIIQ